MGKDTGGCDQLRSYVIEVIEDRVDFVQFRGQCDEETQWMLFSRI